MSPVDVQMDPPDRPGFWTSIDLEPRKAHHFATAVAFVARVTTLYGHLPLENLNISTDPHNGHRLDATAVVGSRRDLLLWQEATGNLISERDHDGATHYRMSITVTGVNFELCAIEKHPTEPLFYECLHCEATFGIGGVSTGSDEDLAAQLAHNEQVASHEAGRCRQAHEPQSKPATECLGVRVVGGPMSALICDEDGWVRGGTFHWGTDYKCTGSVHPPLDSPIWPGHEIRCANPIHVVPAAPADRSWVTTEMVKESPRPPRTTS